MSFDVLIAHFCSALNNVTLFDVPVYLSIHPPKDKLVASTLPGKPFAVLERNTVSVSERKGELLGPP